MASLHLVSERPVEPRSASAGRSSTTSPRVGMFRSIASGSWQSAVSLLGLRDARITAATATQDGRLRISFSDGSRWRGHDGSRDRRETRRRRKCRRSRGAVGADGPGDPRSEAVPKRRDRADPAGEFAVRSIDVPRVRDCRHACPRSPCARRAPEPRRCVGSSWPAPLGPRHDLRRRSPTNRLPRAIRRQAVSLADAMTEPPGSTRSTERTVLAVTGRRAVHESYPDDIG
jgi:hypothetical protein